MLALLSPLLIYAPRKVMPIAALYAIAAGIALALALAGRRLHAALLEDALPGRGDASRFLMTAGTVVLATGLVTLGFAVALLLAFRGCASTPSPWGAGGAAG